eukprot:234362-Prymnesium_polylepis.1
MIAARTHAVGLLLSPHAHSRVEVWDCDAKATPTRVRCPFVVASPLSLLVSVARGERYRCGKRKTGSLFDSKPG